MTMFETLYGVLNGLVFEGSLLTKVDDKGCSRSVLGKGKHRWTL